MERKNKRHQKRIRNLAFVCTLTTIVLGASTYAWFVGMRTVSVSNFEVEIAATNSLSLSLNGSIWDSTINVSQASLGTSSYVGHTNNWAGRGLIPMSSIGEMDTAASRMKIYEKASLTSTAGGYRLLASRVKNYENSDPERDGYVVFDLFIKNFTGTKYIAELNEADEEAIYLTNDSEVTVASDGVANTGIENSVRVAFAQIGRVAGTTTDQAKITGITCSNSTGVTGICRTAQIWEPNDRKHVSNAISWYEESCLARTTADVTKRTSYSGDCSKVVDGIPYPTYAVNTDISSSDRVDVYDGASYNKYTNTTKLTAYDYFTDSEKFLTGTERPTFMTLAPNSITKVRIYIYIEGQDVDNYDFASIGKKISVKFGFTKERFTEDDINYDGPDLNQGEGPDAADKTAPIITLNGNAVMTVTKDSTYVEQGAIVTDNVTTSTTTLANNLSITGTVNTSEYGTYSVLYTVKDEAGNVATKTRTVIVTSSN